MPRMPVPYMITEPIPMMYIRKNRLLIVMAMYQSFPGTFSVRPTTSSVT